MQSENKFFDDLSKVASSAMGVVSGVRDEAENALKARMTRLLADMDLVTREEFEVVKEMAVKAREENAALRAEIESLKASAKPAAKARKTTAKAKTTRARKTSSKD